MRAIHKSVVALVVIWSCVAILGCGGKAELVRRDQRGGVFALKGQRSKAMRHAHEQMAKHCGGAGSYVVVAEEQVATTQGAPNADQRVQPSRNKPKKEYHVSYQCSATSQASVTKAPSTTSSSAPAVEQPGVTAEPAR